MNQDQHLSRRQFIRGRVLPALRATLDDDLAGTPSDRPSPPNADGVAEPGSPRFERAFPVLRPPGAVAEVEFLAGCTRCEACIQACPHQSIIQAPVRYRLAAGTPMIDPIQQPCWMCADFPCIASCEPGVLQRALPKRMATARIETFSCLAWQGNFCTVCSEQCPVPGAIALEADQRFADGGSLRESDSDSKIPSGGNAATKPRIVDEVCTGCGVCQYVCPAPENAILLMPLSDRPSKTIAGQA
jgi:ferredoxin-type protein NapG